MSQHGTTPSSSEERERTEKEQPVNPMRVERDVAADNVDVDREEEKAKRVEEPGLAAAAVLDSTASSHASAAMVEASGVVAEMDDERWADMELGSDERTGSGTDAV